jgi:hypothetical protein
LRKPQHADSRSIILFWILGIVNGQKGVAFNPSEAAEIGMVLRVCLVEVRAIVWAVQKRTQAADNRLSRGCSLGGFAPDSTQSFVLL